MEETRELEFIDKAKPVEKKVDETTRRSFLAKVSGLAAITAMAPSAFARNFIDKYDADGPLARYPNPDIVGLDKQADGGTHVRSTGEVGRIRVTKTESKGKGNKRIRLEIVDT